MLELALALDEADVLLDIDELAVELEAAVDDIDPELDMLIDAGAPPLIVKRPP